MGRTSTRFGLSPARIDLLTSITGVSVDDAWPRRELVEINGRRLPMLSREDFVRNKMVLGRPRDLADIDDLQRQ